MRYAVELNPQTNPNIQQAWFAPFSTLAHMEPPPWTKNNLLVTALRTPYVVTKHPQFTPLNALGWSCYHQNPKRPDFGFFSKNKFCSQLSLFPLTRREIEALKSRIKKTFQHNQRDPWLIVFMTTTEENMFGRRFENILYTKIACFVQNAKKKFYLQSVENRLSKVVDPPIGEKLSSWLRQFSQHTIFIKPTSTIVSTRSIQPYFHSHLPQNSPTLAQPYMSYLNPHPPGDDQHFDPSLGLIGFHPSYHYHKSEVTHSNKLVSNIYNTTCHKYELLKSALNSKKHNKKKKKNTYKIKIIHKKK